MNCLEKYRNRLVRNINRDLRVVRAGLDEEAIHDFRVGVKRLTALFYFLGEIEPSLRAKKVIKPYRRLFKAVSTVRDAQIAEQLIESLDQLEPTQTRELTRVLRARIRRDYRQFERALHNQPQQAVRVPTIRATGISEAAILRHKPVSLQRLLDQVFYLEGRISPEQWHKKRILLKRYRHKLDAFVFCPGHAQDEAELKQIRMLEQLLGDWHDRVTTIALLQAMHSPAADAAIALLKKQDRLLLGSARIYLQKYQRWHNALTTSGR